MPDVGFGGSSSGGSFSAGTLYSDGIGLPSGRAMANGSTACLITALFGYIGGNGGTRTGSLSLGSSATGAFAVGSHASDVGTGWVGSSPWLVNGGTTRFSWNGPSSGTSYFGHGGGGTTYGPSGFSRAGTLGGAYRYAQAPAAPAAPTLTAGPGTLTVAFTAPDDGGAALSGYTIQYGVDPAFTGATSVDVAGTTTLTVTPGALYYVRVAAKNVVTTAAGTIGAWSSAASLRVGIGGHRWDGTAEQPFTTAVRWDGSTEVPITTAVRWDGTQEVPITS